MQRLMKRRTIQKRMDDVGDALTAENETLADAKLFVGDRAGLKKQKLQSKKRIAGKDFLYMEYASPNTSKMAKLTNEQEGEEEEVDDPVPMVNDHRALVEGSKEELSQEELLSMIKTESQMKKAESDFNQDLFEGNSSMVLLTDGVNVSSSRRGGARQSTDLDAADDIILHDPIPCTSKSLLEFERSKITQKLETQKSIEISLDQIKKGGNDEEEDIFADIFASTTAKEKDVEIMESSFSESSSEEEKEINSIKKESKKGIEITLDKTKKVSEEEDLFADVFKIERQPEPKKEEVIQGLTSTMKKSDHLFFKITSKWMESENVVAADIRGETSKTTREYANSKLSGRASKKPKVVSENPLEKENESLIKEMTTKQKEDRLLRFQKMSDLDDPNNSPKMDAGSDDVEEDPDEGNLLSKLDTKAVDIDAYNKKILGPMAEKPRTEETSVYGASAPGFVRSKKLANVVEVGEDVEREPLDPLTVEKLQTIETTEENLPSEEELRNIQVKNVYLFFILSFRFRILLLAFKTAMSFILDA